MYAALKYQLLTQSAYINLQGLGLGYTATFSDTQQNGQIVYLNKEQVCLCSALPALQAQAFLACDCCS